MGLETYHGKTYYYKKIREGDRVRSEYIAGGDMAICCARLDAERRRKAAALKAELEARRAELDAEEGRIVDYLAAVDRAVCQALQAAGYHRPSRKLGWMRDTSMGQDKWMINVPVNVRSDHAALVPLARKVQDGDKEAMAEYRKKADDKARVVLGNGELGGWAKSQMAEKLGRGNPLIKEAALAKMRLLREELAGPSPSRVEWHLADVAAQCWADFQRCMMDRDCLTDNAPLSFRAYHDRRIERAHRRFVRTVKALAGVRRVPNLTAVQVNIGNPAADCLPTDSRPRRRLNT